MDPQQLAEQLVSLPDESARQAFLVAHGTELDDLFAAALKTHADRLRHSDVQRSLSIARLLRSLPQYTNNPCHGALGLLAEANALSIGLGQYGPAIDLYNEAAGIYAACGKAVEQANAQVGKIYALANLGSYDEIWAIGAAATPILEANAQWIPLAGLTMNLAITHGRLGDDAHALVMFDRAGECYRKAGEAGLQALPWIEHNRAIILRNLGQFESSIQASLASQHLLADLGQQIEVARSQQNLALTYFVLGRYNEALALLDEARDVFYGDGRARDAILVDLFTSDCLLQLGRFGDVLEKCRQVRDLFTKLGTRFEVAQAILNEAVAYVGLHRYDDAANSAGEARQLFVAEGNPVWTGYADLEAALVLQTRERPSESLVIAQACAATFGQLGLPVDEARSRLVVARALVSLARYAEATEIVAQVLACGSRLHVPSLLHPCHHLLGLIAEAEDRIQDALVEYDLAIEALESLRGRLMVEFRAGFVADKQILYEDVIDLCLNQGLSKRGLEYAERAKSRALLDLLAYRLDLEIRPQDDADRPLIEKLLDLRQERDRLYRHWDTESGFETRGSPAPSQDGPQLDRDVLSIERQITDLWHKLLVRHADYAREASLWSVRAEPVQPYLSADTLLIEYFAIHQQLIAFLVTQDRVEAHRLPCDLAKIRHLTQLFRLNIEASAQGGPERAVRLVDNARWLLQQLHGALIAPLGSLPESYERWVIVPHGPLHYLPFHAFHNGARYLLEERVVSYLPAASMLRYCTEDRPVAGGARVVFGHSRGGQLPYVVDEAASLGALLGARTFVEEAATVAQLREVAVRCEILHLAAHGDFRPDNPLFSGLSLAGGWLTTLDIFNLHTNASLVTLSACQTGQSVVGGGDELFGLMRAFLYAGAASLVLSLWPVEDRSTAELMTAFYRGLAAGQPKAAALREAQLSFIRREGLADRATAHPYIWAPFFLVGHAGPLAGSTTIQPLPAVPL